MFQFYKLLPVRFGQDQYPLFTRISIETSKVCNRTCWFCPAEQRGKKQQLMTEQLYHKILSELRALNFDGVVQWFFINEPLMDKHYLERIKLLRKLVPKCTIHLTTNWDIPGKMELEVQASIISNLFEAGVNSLNINDYDGRGYKTAVEYVAALLNLPVPLSNHCWKKIGPRKRILSCGPLPKTLHTRTGYTKLEEIETFWKGGSQKGRKHCPRPFRHLVVQYDGKVPLCCTVDPTSAQVEWLADVNQVSLVEAWNSKRVWEYRSLLQDGIRVGQCAKCDAKFSFPSIVRRVDLDEYGVDTQGKNST